MVDPEQYRAGAREAWADAAQGWERRRERFQQQAEPVSRWLVEHLELEDGATVLELAGGPGDTGFLAAKQIGPLGTLISSDGSPEMVEVARRRAEELGIGNAEFKVLEAEWIDLAAASVDAVVCRWGYMLLADPEAALRDTRRVLRPGGRVALAAWDEAAKNPMMTSMTQVLVALGFIDPPTGGGPGPFSFAAEGHIQELLETAGFTDVEVSAVDFTSLFDSPDDYFEVQSDLSPSARPVLSKLAPADHTRMRDALDEKIGPYVQDDGSVRFPARTLVAAAAA
jgi:ubiquinone/menaquinone biosynthesis C-methylase UbiE